MKGREEEIMKIRLNKSSIMKEVKKKIHEMFKETKMQYINSKKEAKTVKQIIKEVRKQINLEHIIETRKINIKIIMINRIKSNN